MPPEQLDPILARPPMLEPGFRGFVAQARELGRNDLRVGEFEGAKIGEAMYMNCAEQK